MTQLFINDMEVALPENFSCKSVSENPFFTKAGDYTLNITLSLENPINLKIFKHINRINSLSRFENRTAMLISDNEVVIRGKEVILKYSNKDIEIQIVAGNSSLNYLIGNNLKIRSLKLGSAIINKNSIVSDLNNRYPDKDWLLLPFYDPDRKFIGNRYTYEKKTQNYYSLKYAYDGEMLSILGFPQTDYFDISSWFVEYENYRPQPFFCFIIEKVMNALGYSLNNAMANHPIFKNSYIVHAQDTLEFAKMLPDWTVEKFFSEIESLFDCTIVVDNELMSSQLIFNNKYYDGFEESNVVMLDEFEAEIEESQDLMIYEKNIAYNLPSSTYYKYQSLPPELRENVVVAPGVGSQKEVIRKQGTQIASINKDNRKNWVNQMWSAYPFNFIDIVRDNKVTPFAVDDYRPLISNYDSETIDVKCDIIPAEFTVMPYYIRGRHDIATNSYMMLQLPIARCSEEPIMNVKSGNNYVFPRVEDYIEKGEKVEKAEDNVEESSYSQLSLALYYATWWGFNEGKSIAEAFDAMPLSFVRSISENYVPVLSDFAYILNYNGSYVNPMSLSFLYQEFYIKNKKIDKKKIYKIRFLNPTKKIDPKQIFIIANKKFYCIKLERNITIDGFDEIVDGEFYSEG